MKSAAFSLHFPYVGTMKGSQVGSQSQRNVATGIETEGKEEMTKRFINGLMKNGNLRVAEKIGTKCAAYIKMGTNTTREGDKTSTCPNLGLGGIGIPRNIIFQAIRLSRPLVGPGARGGFKRKPKAAPIAPKRGARMAIK